MKHVIQPYVATILAAAVVSVATAAYAQDTAAQKAREAKQETKAAARRSGNAITDSWITMKVHSQFVPEDALEDSDIDVTTKGGVVTLTGTVPTAAGKTRAVAIAKATDGVKSVTDSLRVARGDADDIDDAAPKAGAAAREAGREGAAKTREAARDTRDTARGAGRAVSDGWLTSKIYADFIDEDALEDSDIDVDVERAVVTLTGTVRTQAASTRAAAVAQKIEGVKSVKNNLKVSPASR